MSGLHDNFYTAVALVTSGISFAMSVVYFCLAVQRRNKAYMFFGLMGALLFAFFLFPPVGFILNDDPPYSFALLFKRIFIFSYYGLIPWFLLAHTGYQRKWLAYAISALAIICYVIMSFTPEGSEKPFWSAIAVLAFGAIFVLGIQASRWQYLQGDRRQGLWLGVVMGVYGLLFCMTAVNQLTNSALATWFDMQLFFPMHFHSLLFMIVMGQRLVLDLLRKEDLEKVVITRDARWRSFMTNTPFIIMELDRNGDIVFLNDFGVRLLGYQSVFELLNVNWFDRFLKPSDRSYLKDLYDRFLTEDVNIASMKGTIVTKQGNELLIDWSNFPLADTSGVIRNVMSIGKDVTDEDKANRLVQKLKNELLKEQLDFRDQAAYTDLDIVGTSKALLYALQKAKQVSVTQVPVLLEGETGVGKELFADMIHRQSSRSQRPFIKVNCGGLPKELIEDELFGHEKGAFTSAHQSRKGRFELADGGTIFLDEIGELPHDMQPKLLRVLQNGEFERIGGQKTIKVDVRILAATNRVLSEEVKHGRFRSDLFYRLNVFPITIPPLRKRKDDLPMLINFFIARKCRKYNKQITEISHSNMQRLLDHAWPGNIRELKNVIERAVINSEGQTLTFDWWETATEQLDTPPDTSLEQIDREHILTIMEKCRWKINGDDGAARMLNMNPNTLRSKMKRLGIKRPGNADSPTPGHIERY